MSPNRYPHVTAQEIDDGFEPVIRGSLGGHDIGAALGRIRLGRRRRAPDHGVEAEVQDGVHKIENRRVEGVGEYGGNLDVNDMQRETMQSPRGHHEGHDGHHHPYAQLHADGRTRKQRELDMMHEEGYSHFARVGDVRRSFFARI